MKKGYESIGCEPQFLPVASDEDYQAGRWSGTETTECRLQRAEGWATHADS